MPKSTVTVHHTLGQQEALDRIKNILATVSAIASQTLRDTDLATARAVFDQRLQALGRAHDILNRTRWTSASASARSSPAGTPASRA